MFRDQQNKKMVQKLEKCEVVFILRQDVNHTTTFGGEQILQTKLFVTQGEVPMKSLKKAICKLFKPYGIEHS